MRYIVSSWESFSAGFTASILHRYRPVQGFLCMNRGFQKRLNGPGFTDGNGGDSWINMPVIEKMRSFIKQGANTKTGMLPLPKTRCPGIMVIIFRNALKRRFPMNSD